MMVTVLGPLPKEVAYEQKAACLGKGMLRG